MDDNQRRLLALQQSNPSIRLWGKNVTLGPEQAPDPSRVIAPDTRSNVAKVANFISSKTQAAPGDNRSNVARVWNTINLLDNGKSWNNFNATNDKSILQQAIDNHKAGFAGMGRSVVGSAQALSGLYDLASRGTGTSRVSQFLNKKAEGIDAYVKNNNLDPVAYTAGQIGGDTAQLLAGGEVAQGLSKGAKVTEFLGKLGAPGRFLARLIPGGAETAQNVLQGAGQRTARGEDNSWKTVGLDAGFSVAMAGLIEGSKYGSNKIAEFLAKESDPKVIKSILPEISDQTAETLSKIDSPEEIQKAIDKVRMSDVNLNAKKAVKDPINATTIAPTAKGISPDALDTVLQTITDSTSKSDINKLVKQILPDLSTGQAKSLSKKLAETNDTNAIVNAIADAMDKKPAPKLNQESLVANTQPVEPVPGSTQEAQAVVSAQNGTSTTPVAESAPNQAVAPQAGEAGAVSTPVNQAADTAAKAVPNTTTSLPPEVQSTADAILSAKRDMTKTANKSIKNITEQKGQRLARVTGEGADFMTSMKQNLKGEYKKGSFTPIDINDKQFNDAIAHVQNVSGDKFDTFNFGIALGKATGREPGMPTVGDIKLLAKYLGPDVAEAVNAQFSPWRRFMNTVAEASGIPKALMASGDLSFGGRQGAVLGARFPKEWSVANIEGVKYAASPEYFDKAMAEIRNLKDVNGSSAFDFMTKKMGIELEAAQGATEEAFSGFDSVWSKVKGKFDPNSTAAKTIDAAGKWNGVAMSDRAFSGSASKLRSDVAMNIINKYGGIAEIENWTPKALKDLGRVINTATGRGELGAFEKYGPALSKTLFSPRLWKSKLDLLNPIYYAKLAPEARKLALQTSGSFAGVVSATLAAAAAAGAAVETDPRSSDFGKIKVGNTRYDIMGGLQQNIVLAAREITGQKKNSETGEIVDLSGPDHKFGQADRMSVVGDFLQNKSNPLLNTAITIGKGEDKGGNPVNPWTEIAKLFIPLNASGTFETANDLGNANPFAGPVDAGAIAKGVAMNIPGTFGAGVQTYGTVATRNMGKPTETGQKTWKGKIGPDFVLDKNGQPILDAKGKPTKVKFTPGATDLEKQAQLDQAQKSALASQYKNRLSTEDQALLKLSPTERQQYLDSGKIDQARFDALAQHDQNIKNLDGVEIPKELKSTVGKNFYNTYNAMTKANQEAYLNGPADSNSQKIASNINRDLPEGISKLTPTNKLAKLYSDYEIAINKPGVDQVDKRNILKTFLSTAVKQNQSDTVQGIYNEGGSEDLKYFINAGAVFQSDLDKAIQIDNELYNSGLSGSLKFSKKFRSLMGYDTPASRSGSGGGSGANISVPSFSTPAFRLPRAKTSSAPKLKARLNLSKPSPKTRIKIAL